MCVGQVDTLFTLYILYPRYIIGREWVCGGGDECEKVMWAIDRDRWVWEGQKKNRVRETVYI